MNVIESAAERLGKLKGYFRKGVDQVFSTAWSNPSLNDASAWAGLPYWGEGMSSRKPQNKIDYVSAFASWVYTCVKLNAQSVASVPLRLYVAKKSKSQKFKTAPTRTIIKMAKDRLWANAGYSQWLRKAEDVEEVTEHPFLELMQNVNPWANRRDLWESTTMFLDLTGEAYWYMPKARLGVPTEVYVIPSQWMEPIWGDSLDKAIVGYKYTRTSEDIRFLEREVIYFAYPNPHNIFKGFSIIRGIADAVYLLRQMNEFETSLMENRARVGGVITQTEKMTPDAKARLKEQFNQEHTGHRNSGKLMVLPFGLEFQKDTMTPEELSFIEGRRLNRTEIMAAFDVPEGAIISESVNLANAETADYRHAKNGVAPRLQRIEEKLNERLMPRYGDNIFCAFDDCVPENKEFALKERTAHISGSITTINEERGKIGLEEVEGGDQVLVPMNLIPLGTVMEPDRVPPSDEEQEDEPASAQGGTGPEGGDEEGEEGKRLEAAVMKRVKEKLGFPLHLTNPK